MFSRIFFSLFLLSSCSLFKAEKSLRDEDSAKLLESIKLSGEGRGRLSIRQTQNIFSYESLLKENSDWILAVAIPLQGEEVMIFPDLKVRSLHSKEVQSFERRLENALRQEFGNDSIGGERFLSHLRGMVRFIQAKDLGLDRKCQNMTCELDGETYQLEVLKKEFRIQSKLSDDFSLEARAQNLTGPIFGITQFVLLDQKTKKNLLSLELFWN